MRLHTTAILGAALLSLGLAGTAVAGTKEPPSPQPASPATVTDRAQADPALNGACYKQLANDNGVGIVSQNFEAADDIYDARAADDFTLKRHCKVNKVTVNGSYSLGAGPAESVHVTFYRDNGGRVGGIISTQDNLTYRDASELGNFTVTLAGPANLKPGTYWVSVKANMHFALGGQWGWNTNNHARGERSKWANPNDGFGTGCVVYTDTVRCIPSGEGPDFSFALLS